MYKGRFFYFYLIFLFKINLLFIERVLIGLSFYVQVKKITKVDFRHFSSNDFLQWTAGKLRRKLKFWDMGFFQKIPIYQTHEEFAEKSERFGRISGCSGHVFHKCGHLRNLAEFLLGIGLFKEQISVCTRGGSL